MFGGNALLEVRVDANLNHDYPVAVELILLYDKALDDELTGLDSKTWFASRDQYRADYSKSQYESWYWEWVPGQVVAPQQFRYETGAVSAILFASYASPGDHRARVAPPDQNMALHLRKDDFTVGPASK